MKTENPDTAEYVRSHWKYDKVSGEMRGRGGKVIGHRRKDGALHALAYTPQGKVCVLLHRAAWLLVTGQWPARGIDHHNGVKADNRWCNIREATDAQNRQNLKATSAKGRLRGCTPYYRKWKAQIKDSQGRHHYLGLFSTESEAHAAYCAAKTKLHPFQPVQRRD
jgi:hypothetical protein